MYCEDSKKESGTSFVKLLLNLAELSHNRISVTIDSEGMNSHLSSSPIYLKVMPTEQFDLRSREQLLAMRDSAAGAFEASRIRYKHLADRLENKSLHYIYNKVDASQVMAAAEQLLEAKTNVEEAARRTRLFQDILDKMPRRPHQMKERNAQQRTDEQHEGVNKTPKQQKTSRSKAKQILRTIHVPRPSHLEMVTSP